MHKRRGCAAWGWCMSKASKTLPILLTICWACALGSSVTLISQMSIPDNLKIWAGVLLGIVLTLASQHAWRHPDGK